MTNRVKSPFLMWNFPTFQNPTDCPVVISYLEKLSHFLPNRVLSTFWPYLSEQNVQIMLTQKGSPASCSLFMLSSPSLKEQVLANVFSLDVFGIYKWMLISYTSNFSKKKKGSCNLFSKI